MSRSCFALMIFFYFRLISLSWGQTDPTEFVPLSAGVLAYEKGDWRASKVALEQAVLVSYDDLLYSLQAQVYFGPGLCPFRSI